MPAAELERDCAPGFHPLSHRAILQAVDTSSAGQRDANVSSHPPHFPVMIAGLGRLADFARTGWSCVVVVAGAVIAGQGSVVGLGGSVVDGPDTSSTGAVVSPQPAKARTRTAAAKAWALDIAGTLRKPSAQDNH